MGTEVAGEQHWWQEGKGAGTPYEQGSRKGSAEKEEVRMQREGMELCCMSDGATNL